MSESKKIIICADDLGLTRGINEAIFKAYNAGVITATSIVATSVYFDEAVRLVKECRIPCGVHLAIATEFDKRPMKPLLASTPCQSDGAMYPNIYPYLDGLDERAVYKEFCEQIDRVKGTGITINHIDSHIHVYSTEVLERLSKKYSVPCRDLYELGKYKCGFFHFTISGKTPEEKSLTLLNFLDNICEKTNIIVTHPTMDVEEMKEYVSEEHPGRFLWQTGLRFQDLPALLDESVIAKLIYDYKNNLSNELY